MTERVLGGGRIGDVEDIIYSRAEKRFGRCCHLKTMESRTKQISMQFLQEDCWVEWNRIMFQACDSFPLSTFFYIIKKKWWLDTRNNYKELN